jgi:quinol-cytochrome oxidoreductase complex cytochrome b subunit
MDIEQKAGLQFMGEMGGALVLLAGASWARHQNLGPVVALLPIIPVWLMLWASIRYYFRVDEYQRLRFVQAAALSAGILFCLDWSYPYAQTVFGLPPQPEIVSWHFSIIFVVVTFIGAIRGKQARRA